MYAVFKVRYQAYSLNLTAKSYKPMGLSGLEPPTSRLSGVRSNQLSYKPFCFRKFFIYSGSHLLSHTVSSAVPSAAWVLTIVFGMGTGVSPKRIATRNFLLSTPLVPPSHSFGSALLHLTRAKALMHPFAYEDFREQAPGFLSSDVCALAL